MQNSKSSQKGSTLIVALITFIVLTLGALGLLLYVSSVKTKSPITAKKQDALIYKRSEGWGPCPDKTMTCQLETDLYESGKLVFIGDVNKEVQLDKETVGKIVNAIEQSGVLEKNCSGPMILDYTVEYEINIKGKTKRIGIEDTNCRGDFSETNKIINSYYGVKRKGGA